MNANLTAKIAVVLGGVLLFLLVFFADKTQLTNPAAELDGASTKETDQATEMPQDSMLLAWVGRAEQVKDKSQLAVLDSLISKLSSFKRWDLAVKYAEKKLNLSQSVQDQFLLGEVAQKAYQAAQDEQKLEVFNAKAIKAFEVVLQSDSLNEKARLNLGLAYIESRKQENSMKGILNIRKVTEINPKNAVAQYQLGLFSMQTGQFEKAEKRFEQALEVDKSNEWAKFYLALAKKKLGKQAEVKALLEVLSATTNPELKAKLAELE